MATILDDKSEHVIPFVLRHYEAHRQRSGQSRPMFVGLQGVQGAGKTTLVDTLYETLSSPPHNISTLVFSIDDLYLTHDDQTELAESHSDNPLAQHRGIPGTHDLQLGAELFEALEQQKPDIALPSYDKSAYRGAGDRRPREFWQMLNPGGRRPIDLVIFEGWCVGFKALSDHELRQSWELAKSEYATQGPGYQGQLGKHLLSSIDFMNHALRGYDVVTNRFACFVQIDAEDSLHVYDWRLEQEAVLRQKTGSGMTDKQVVNFVNGYYPAYELYTDTLRHGIMSNPKSQLRLVVGKNRQVKEVHTL